MGMVVYLGSLSNRNIWAEAFHGGSSLESVAGPRASSSRLGLVRTAEERHIGLGCTRQRSGRGRNARHTCGRHSPWPGGAYARGRRHPCLVNN